MSPATLDEFVPRYLDAVPTDPFDGQPMRYTFRPHDRYTLYTVGIDGNDNGGREDRTRRNWAVYGDNHTGFDYRLDPWASN